jgi:type I restriction-modification system DNA methylase subunit
MGMNTQSFIKALQKRADKNGISIQKQFSQFVDSTFKSIQVNDLSNLEIPEYLEVVLHNPLQDILGQVCFEIGRLESRRGQFMTRFEEGNSLAKGLKITKYEMLDFSCGSGVMGLITLNQIARKISEQFVQDIPNVQIHLNDIDHEMTKIATIQTYMNWVFFYQHFFDLDLLVTQNNVISDWEEPLKVVYQSSGSKQNYNTFSDCKKSNLMLNPPFGLKDYGKSYADSHSNQERFKYGIPNKADGEYAFILSAINLMTENGKAFLILPNGVLFKDSSKKFREAIMEEGLLEGLIQLPNNIFEGTSIPACVFMLNKNNPHPEKVFMVNTIND